MSATDTNTTIDHVLTKISTAAPDLDANPDFPYDAFAELARCGALAGGASPSEQWALVRAVARADGSVARILDGHLNGVERLELLASEPLRSAELDRVREGRLLIGVWGADPVAEEGEGDPARVISPSAQDPGESDTRPRLRGVKTFCSGAGGVDRALVLARADAPGAPVLAYVDTRDERCEIDRSWYRGSGMRASESHRVVFDDVPVLAVLGEPGEISREPWFGRDGIRTAATWAGLADCAVGAALEDLAARRPDDPLAALAAGRLYAAQATIDAWFDRARVTVEGDPEAPTADLSIALRAGVSTAITAIIDEAARACGSRPFAAGGTLDRARRDLELFVLQHRLDPLLGRLGARLLAERAP